MRPLNPVPPHAGQPGLRTSVQPVSWLRSRPRNPGIREADLGLDKRNVVTGRDRAQEVLFGAEPGFDQQRALGGERLGLTHCFVAGAPLVVQSTVLDQDLDQLELGAEQADDAAVLRACELAQLDEHLAGPGIALHAFGNSAGAIELCGSDRPFAHQ